MENDTIIQLYVSFKDDSKGFLNLHRQHFTQFVTIILAVLAASIGATYQFRKEGWLILAVAFGPFLNVALSVVAIALCNRFYKRFLEHEAVGDKLYCLLDETNKIDSKVDKNKNILPGDSHLFPDRWVNDLKQYQTTTEFVKDRVNKGSNKFIQITFFLLIIANLALGIGLTIAAFRNILDPLCEV